MEAREIMILVFSILTTSSLLIALYGHYRGSEDHTLVGYIALVAIGLVCWGLIGSVSTVTKTDLEADVLSITKGKYEIYVSIKNSDDLLIFDKLIDFDNITDTTTFYVVEERNMYNITTEENKWDYYYIVNRQKIYSNE